MVWNPPHSTSTPPRTCGVVNGSAKRLMLLSVMNTGTST